MDEYKKEYRKLEIRNCEKHEDTVYSLACKTCDEVFCAKCMVGLQVCSNGKYCHALVLWLQLTVIDSLKFLHWSAMLSFNAFNS